ncbi:hypothetical protein GCM10022247_01580 [Allokutzneria multivorans]|uniref:Prephenate/arogenate dehydrogenase domain-containing protein n=1 Tax=Allokutzneria multivorans TaxID=1142134 RepID=A0ABP7QRR1_9PSEU
MAGGAGAVGGLLVELLRGCDFEVHVLDIATGADITAPPAEVGSADVVVLAVPEPVALAAIEPLAAAMKPGALLVDTLSVKGPVVSAIREHMADFEALSINPMFAPSLGMRGRAVAAVSVHSGPRSVRLLELIEGWGARVVLVGAEEHDRLAAAAQVLTHAAVLGFGVALTELDVDIADLTALAPPPHAMLLALLARIAGGTPEVYWDVQSANPQAPAARKALASGVRRLAEVIENGGEEEFTGLLGTLTDFFGTDLGRYRDLCARTFAGMEQA